MKNLSTTNKSNRKEYPIDIDVLNKFREYINRTISYENNMHCRYGEDRINFKTNDDIARDLENVLSKCPDDIQRIKDVYNPIVNEYISKLYNEVCPLIKTILSYDDYIYQIDEEE